MVMACTAIMRKISEKACLEKGKAAGLRFGTNRGRKTAAGDAEKDTTLKENKKCKLKKVKVYRYTLS